MDFTALSTYDIFYLLYAKSPKDRQDELMLMLRHNPAVLLARTKEFNSKKYRAMLLEYCTTYTEIEKVVYFYET